MLEQVNFINNELQQIFVRGVDCAHMINALNMLQQVQGQAAEYDQMKADQEKAEEEKPEKETTKEAKK